MKRQRSGLLCLPRTHATELAESSPLDASTWGWPPACGLAESSPLHASAEETETGKRYGRTDIN
eukprot:3733219-Amphidinium_carterae.1